MAATGCSGRNTTVLIAIGIRLYREGLEAALKAEMDISVVGAATCPLETRAAVSQLQPDVLVVDVAMDGVLTVMRWIHAESPRTRILAFAVCEDISRILEYARAGAEGFIGVNGSLPELVEAIQRTSKGELLCSPRVAADLLRCAAQRDVGVSESQVAVCTGRERQVLSLLRTGRSTKEIATALCIAEATVKNHVHNILEKLRVSTRYEAASVTFEQRDPPEQRRDGASTNRQ